MTLPKFEGCLEEVIRTLVIELENVKTMVLGQENAMQPIKQRRSNHEQGHYTKGKADPRHDSFVSSGP